MKKATLSIIVIIALMFSAACSSKVIPAGCANEHKNFRMDRGFHPAKGHMKSNPSRAQWRK